MTTGGQVEVRVVRDYPTAPIVRLYEAGGWWREHYDPSHIPPMLRGSYAVAVAVDAATGETVGMGRVISDGASDAYVQDVMATLPGGDRRGSWGFLERCRADRILWVGSCLARPRSRSGSGPASASSRATWPCASAGRIDRADPRRLRPGHARGRRALPPPVRTLPAGPLGQYLHEHGLLEPLRPLPPGAGPRLHRDLLDDRRHLRLRAPGPEDPGTSPACAESPASGSSSSSPGPATDRGPPPGLPPPGLQMSTARQAAGSRQGLPDHPAASTGSTGTARTGRADWNRESRGRRARDPLVQLEGLRDDASSRPNAGRPLRDRPLPALGLGLAIRSRRVAAMAIYERLNAQTRSSTSRRACPSARITRRSAGDGAGSATTSATKPRVDMAYRASAGQSGLRTTWSAACQRGRPLNIARLNTGFPT
jgi:hypothetical protein